MNPKSKGSGYEREIAEKLSLWYSEGERDDIFYRSNSSGARFTARRKNKKDTANQAGDITFTDAIGEPLIKAWNIECKTGYGKWDVLDIVDSKQKKTTLEKHWEQCVKDAERSGRFPVLIFRRTRKYSCIVFNERTFYDLMRYFGIKYQFECLHLEKTGMFIMTLTTFFDWIPNIHAYLAKRAKRK